MGELAMLETNSVMVTASGVRRSCTDSKFILNFWQQARKVRFHQNHSTISKMSDTEMDGGVALGGTSPTHSQLADEINGGAMDVKSNGAASVADSTVSSRLYVACSLCPLQHSC
jgi:hypothetical protein